MRYFGNMQFIKAKYAVTISIIISLLMIISSVVEYFGNKEEIYRLISENAINLIETISQSSENTIISDREIEALLISHLLGVGRNIARLDSLTEIGDAILTTVVEENDVHKINVFDGNGNKIFSSGEDSSHITGKPKYSPKDFIKPVLDGTEDEIILGLKESRFEDGTRFAIAVRRPINKSGAIVVNLDAESFLEFREKTGFGKMIHDIGDKEEVEYVILQTPEEIIAANEVIKDTGSFSSDTFLVNTYKDTLIKTREYYYEGRKIFEVAKRFQIGNEIIGIFRVGLHTEEIDSLNSRLIRRTIITSIVIIIILITVILIIISGQNYKLIKTEYRKIQTFTGEILNNMSLAVISSDENRKIKIFNKSAENLFKIKAKDVLEKDAAEVFEVTDSSLKNIFSNRETPEDRELKIKSGDIVLLINAYRNVDSEGKLFAHTLVINDITEIKKLEERSRLNEKLVSMGELASAVAHEVRNPLNTINMISQRYCRESERLGTGGEELQNLNKILRSESERVNKIIRQFLLFARPPKINLTETESGRFLKDVKDTFEIDLQGTEITLNTIIDPDKRLMLDTDQFKQVLLNLLINAKDSIQGGGNIWLRYYKLNNKNIFEVEDSGDGIPGDIKEKIFNLYYTTKVKGTGLGLSIVKQIVEMHGGSIKAESEIKKGTKFIIELNEN